MAGVKPMISTDISEIQRQMAQIRHDMHHEVQCAVRSAQSLTDWRSSGQKPSLAVPGCRLACRIFARPPAPAGNADDRDRRIAETGATGGCRVPGAERKPASPMWRASRHSLQPACAHRDSCRSELCTRTSRAVAVSTSITPGSRWFARCAHAGRRPVRQRGRRPAP